MNEVEKMTSHCKNCSHGPRGRSRLSSSIAVITRRSAYNNLQRQLLVAFWLSFHAVSCASLSLRVKSFHVVADAGEAASTVISSVGGRGEAGAARAVGDLDFPKGTAASSGKASSLPADGGPEGVGASSAGTTKSRFGRFAWITGSLSSASSSSSSCSAAQLRRGPATLRDKLSAPRQFLCPAKKSPAGGSEAVEDEEEEVLATRLEEVLGYSSSKRRGKLPLARNDSRKGTSVGSRGGCGPQPEDSQSSSNESSPGSSEEEDVGAESATSEDDVRKTALPQQSCAVESSLRQGGSSCRVESSLRQILRNSTRRTEQNKTEENKTQKKLLVSL
ncbi:unnamed protein product [Amoebophrya sp. A25]|nr:unnamed protein product [Amoebophrya sp. A25]|eukprot:GSA25T00010907001.1